MRAARTLAASSRNKPAFNPWLVKYAALAVEPATALPREINCLNLPGCLGETAMDREDRVVEDCSEADNARGEWGGAERSTLMTLAPTPDIHDLKNPGLL